MNARILVLGLSFKENTPDLRNTRVVDIIAELREYNARVDVHDPWVDASEAAQEYGLELCTEPEPGSYDAILIAVAHEQYRKMGIDAVRALGQPGAVVFDVKYVFPADATDGRL